MKHFIQNTTYSLVCLLAVFFLSSCDTDIEPVDINESGINSQNSELYSNYLTNLKAYKQTKHQVVFGWFDNSEKIPASQGQTLLAVPDSLDYLVLTNPSDLTRQELLMMANLRETKGIKILYEISFEKLKTLYAEKKEAFLAVAENAGLNYTAFNNFLVDSVQSQLILCDQYNFDGVVMTYEGKYRQYLTDAEKLDLISQENIFIGIAKDWKTRHENKMLVLAGKPQNVTDQTIFDVASYLIIPCQSATAEGGVAYAVNKAAVAGVPTDKLVPWVTTTSLDATDLKTGYWGNDVKAVIGAARWVAEEHDSYQIAGLAIDNMNNDYYYVKFTYPNVRTAISIINPTVKN